MWKRRSIMKIFLAGASGAVGRLLLPLLVKAGHEVVGTTRSAAKAGNITAAGGQPIVLDALDREAVFVALRDAQPDVVIHQLTDLTARDWAANMRLRIEGPRTLVDAAKAVGVQRMIAQSISWVAVPGEGLSNENDPLDLERGESIEAVQSLEKAVTEMPVGVVLRYGYFYGPGTWYARDGLTTEQVKRGELEATEGVSSFVHVADAAQAAVEALNWPAGIYNIVDDEPAPATDWLTTYASLAGAPAPAITSDKAAWERGESNAKAKQQGWTPQYPSWREGFKKELV
jgi:nucleoside-diphosphate-sugar epimerase